MIANRLINANRKNKKNPKEKMRNRLTFILLIFLSLFSCQTKKGDYVCTPCDLKCDDLTFSEAGICPHCKMALVKKSELNKEKELILNQIEIKEGSGIFLVEGGIGNEDKRIKVFYHKPKNFSPTSGILIVVPGAGRNGDSYRDAWIDESEAYNLLILSPMYPESTYGFEDYHLGGLITDTNFKNSVEYIENTNIATLDETKFDFNINSNSNEWIFNDFDRIFDLTIEALNSKQTSYDMFGHSAGGHILHRLALFQKKSKAARILASNPSFYTLPDFEVPFPFGCKNAPITQEALKYAFEKELVVFLGEMDNENETGGTFLRSTTADKQGLHRFERGKFFYSESKTIAEALKLEFHWDLVIVQNVGHNHQRMGAAAANYLYGEREK
ncbi:hypothetical protein AAG747_09600 [Rapidithrix thailandica]|uniref:Alpha/beta hydrolase n=1 Tax=Rapidithrix thailandica TaxID=413964 RepID=A0AAW9S707_9BACT